jgi:hypothetical protein
MILMKTGMHYEPAAIYLVCVLYGPSRPVCPTNIRRSHAADEGQLWVETGRTAKAEKRQVFGSAHSGAAHPVSANPGLEPNVRYPTGRVRKRTGRFPPAAAVRAGRLKPRDGSGRRSLPVRIDCSGFLRTKPHIAGHADRRRLERRRRVVLLGVALPGFSRRTLGNQVLVFHGDTSPERAAPALRRACHGGGTGPRTGRRCRSNQVRRRCAGRESLSGMQHELLDWSLPVGKETLVDAATSDALIGGESYRLLGQGAIRLCRPVEDKRKMEKNRDWPGRKS